MSSIVGYIFEAGIYCRGCILDFFMEENAYPYVLPEEWLDHCAELEGVNRADESSFDSADFPKVITRQNAEQLAEWRITCNKCSAHIGDEQ